MNVYDANKIKQRIPDIIIGQQIYIYDEVSSTMQYARSLAFAGAIEGTVVLASKQSAGHGRFERVWFSPPGNIYISLILKPSKEQMPLLFAVCALAVQKMLQKYGIKATFKWPNDVLVGAKKICGTLIEGYSQNGYTTAICGVGLNVNFNVKEHQSLADNAISMSGILGQVLDLNEVTAVFLQEFNELYINEDADSIFKLWKSHLSFLGNYVYVCLDDGNYIHGLAVDVNIQGQLLLKDNTGNMHTVSNGDVCLN